MAHRQPIHPASDAGRVLAVFEILTGITVREICLLTGLSQDRVYYTLNRLYFQGRTVRDENWPQRHYLRDHFFQKMQEAENAERRHARERREAETLQFGAI